MNTYIFGMPPAGEVAQLPEYGVGTIPSPFREQLVSEYERHYPGVYIIAGIDTSKETFALYHRTRETWINVKDIKELVLTPTGPAKGPGYIEIGWQSETATWPTGFLWSVTYSKTMHEWMRERIIALGKLIDRPCRETQVYADC
jgi:hypothetical protein